MNITNRVNHLQAKADKLARQHIPPDNSVLAVQSADPSSAATVSAELPASLQPAYAAPMTDTSAVSYKELEQIVAHMRQQSVATDRVRMVGNHTAESERDESAYDAVDDMWMSTIEQMQLASSSLRHITLSDDGLCPAYVVEQYRRELQLQAAPNAENIHLSLCGGMGADAFVMRQVGAKFTKTILVGKEEIKRTICDNLNPPELMSDGGVDYAWHTDVHDITRDDIQKLGTGSIGRLDISAPCKAFALSMARLLSSKYGGKLKNPRPGLQGRHGKVLLSCLQVTAWVREFNPNCEIFCENLPFKDLVADWKLVCLALGQPIVIDSADYSCTRRLRAFWTNVGLLPSQEELTQGFSPINPNHYMRTGRTLEPYIVDHWQDYCSHHWGVVDR